ncbi:sigma 54-interacting transcriptional regulator [Melioribacteraceae bacterium 4301-Me]|uniref:sigma 54-interacting transcriptional regulator n=1 Tax=Pyranulibacter aquaticus TaxID=3163344 RepID=UPI00359A1020
MNKLDILLKYKKRIYLVCIVIGLSIVLLFGGFSNQLNRDFEKLFYKVLPNKELDKSIILITIDSNDIETLGGWPLKRSYYALLINKLSQLKTKVIGLEIMLSDRTPLQSVYNDLLNDELKKANNVVLSSVVIKLKNETLHDSIIFSQPKYFVPSLKSGHLDYFVSDGIYIPTKIAFGDSYEKSFSSVISEFMNKKADDLVEVNFYNSWKNFTRYSLLDFFSMIDNNNNELKNFRNKAILIGVTDPSIAKHIQTNFDDNLPGIALHAFAVDNILTERSINYKAKPIVNTIVLLFLIILTQLNIDEKVFKIYLMTTVLYLIVSVVLLYFFYIQFNYSAFIIPLLFLFSFDSVMYMLKNKIYLRESLSQSEILKLSLKRKEEQLKKLQKELDLAENSQPSELIAKVNYLKNAVAKLQKEQLNNEPAEAINEVEIKNFHGLVYKSKLMDDVVSLIEKVAQSDATVLIEGESGSGKELAARAIHKLSKRSKNNFIAVNCAALTESLLESELFGHVKGSFTNAVADKKGKFELADNGTIFLDEIGETSENFQAKLLRVIQFGEIAKVGSTSNLKVDVRIIAATNKNLEQLVKEKKFREDLFYRLNVIKISMPSLRDRKEDIEVLANYFVGLEDAGLKLSKGVVDVLKLYEWKGNVRELESVLKRAVILAKAENRKIIKLHDLPQQIAKTDNIELEMLILESLREKQFSHSSINETAKELNNLSRTVVAENLRGMFFKVFYESNFNFETAVRKLADSNDEKVLERVSSKAEIYLKNVSKDLVKYPNRPFEEIKPKIISKYKNLPSKFHYYFDEFIKYLLENSPGKF